MLIFGLFALIAWIPITIILFAMMPPRKAVTTSLVGAWLLLPPIAIPLPGLPDYSKVTATTFGILFGTMLFDLPRLVAVRPRWFDLPMVIYCACPFASAISNNDGAYDGFSATLAQLFMWLLPYLIGRLYFADMEGLRTLAVGVTAGGIAYIPPCLWEIRLSPHLSRVIYGTTFKPNAVRFGGYRPNVFLSDGLELGMWMSAASLAAWWLWRSGLLKKMLGLPFGTVLLPTLLITTILCKSSGALLLLFVGMVTLWGSVRFKTKGLLLCIILIPPLYCTSRGSGLWTGDALITFFNRWFDEERSFSIKFRLLNENLLIERALERPLLGWGGWGRNLQVDPEKLVEAGLPYQAIPDGLWIIALGVNGLVGLTSLALIILLPPTIFLIRIPPGEWGNSLIAPAAMFSTLLSIYMIDCLANGMLNLVYIVTTGGLSAAVLSFNRHNSYQPTPLIAGTPPPFSNRASGEAQVELEVASTVPTQDKLARRYTDLGRSLAIQGRRSEAKAAWSQALDFWTRLTSTHPNNPRFRSSWCDFCNDLAWFLLDEPVPSAGDASQAVALAIKATESFPERSTYWNTLGAAYYRAGDDQSAVEAIHQSLLLQDDNGTAFDYFYLAMACSRLAQYDIARSWYEKGLHWITEHAHDDAKLKQLGHEAKESLVLRVGEI